MTHFAFKHPLLVQKLLIISHSENKTVSSELYISSEHSFSYRVHQATERNLEQDQAWGGGGVPPLDSIPVLCYHNTLLHHFLQCQMKLNVGDML